MKHEIEIDGRKITFEASENDAEFIGRIVPGLIGMRGFVNLDAADIAEVLDGAKIIAVGEGAGTGDDKVKAAALEAVRNTPGISGAGSVIAGITSGFETFLAELSEAAFTIEAECGEAVNIVWGHVLDDSMDDSVRVNIIAVA